MRKKGFCTNCRREMIIHGKGICVTCYKKLFWKPLSVICKRCKRQMPHHSKGYCPGCYNTLFFLQNIKNHNHQKRHKISPEIYNQITKSCIVCGFDKFVELHHVDCNRHNNSKENMVGLCPNHHKMIHTLKWKEEVLTQIRKSLLEKELPQSLNETDAETDETEAETDKTQAPEFQLIELPIKNKLNLANAC